MIKTVEYFWTKFSVGEVEKSEGRPLKIFERFCGWDSLFSERENYEGFWGANKGMGGNGAPGELFNCRSRGIVRGIRPAIGANFSTSSLSIASTLA